MNYRELLQNENWKIKREEILNRDSNTCQRCGIKKNVDIKSLQVALGKKGISNYTLDFFNIPDFNTNLVRLNKAGLPELICKTNLSEYEINSNADYRLTINFVDLLFIKYPYNGATINNLKDNIFHDDKTNSKLIEVLRKKSIKDVGIDVDKEGIWLEETHFTSEFTKNCFSLHVHHKCYRKDVEIWNQNNNEYVSLCNVCHQIVHHNQLIPFYDNLGKIIQYMQPCNRCNGKRIIERYKHVEHGICFKCDGKGTIPK